MSDLVNSSLNLSKEDIIAADEKQTMKIDGQQLKIQGLPTDELIRILKNMNQHLTSLLVILFF